MHFIQNHQLSCVCFPTHIATKLDCVTVSAYKWYPLILIQLLNLSYLPSQHISVFFNVIQTVFKRLNTQEINTQKFFLLGEKNASTLSKQNKQQTNENV